MFIIKKGKPYFINDEKTYIYPCKIDALSYSVDFKSPESLAGSTEPLGAIMTENEIRCKYNIDVVDAWDSEHNKVIKKSNKVVSSILNKKE